MKRPPPAHYYKCQTQWTRVPARIESHRCNAAVIVMLHGERPVTDPPRMPVSIFLTPHEALSFASWLAEQAEHLLAKQAKAAARAAAQAAAREAKQ